jgi:excisionase family DNA binding protein
MSAQAAPQVPSLTVDAREAARLIGVSLSHVHNLRHSGRWGPTPIYLGRSVRFSRAELEAWVASGSPSLDRWKLIRGQAQK